MTNEQLNALEAGAKAATPGPWGVHSSSVYAACGAHVAFLPEVCSSDPACCVTPEQVEANANFIATANPAVVLDLIAELRQVRRERDWLAEKMEEGTNCCLPENEECACSFCSDCEYNTQESWLEAAKEAVK